MNKSTSLKSSKAARPCKSSAAQILKLEIPVTVRRSLAACAAHVEQTPENYILCALLARIRCDVDYIRADAHATAAGIEEAVI